MDWKFNGGKPVYQQIMQKLRDAILSGEFPPGSRIPSVRELALEARVNPNTMQRALAQLEQEAILVGGGTAGRCVTADQAVLEQLRRAAVEESVRECAEKFRALGVSAAEAAALLVQYDEREEKVWTES